MTYSKLMTTAAAAALVTTTAFAATDRIDLIEQDGASEPTVFNGEVVETAPELQNAETKDRQNPQAVDPVYDNAEASAATIETFQAVEGTNGSPVKLEDGTELGTLLEMDIDNAGKGEMTIDISDSQKIRGEELTITTGPENVMIDGGTIIVMVDADELANLAGGDKGQDDGRQRVYLN